MGEEYARERWKGLSWAQLVCALGLKFAIGLTSTKRGPMPSTVSFSFYQRGNEHTYHSMEFGRSFVLFTCFSSPLSLVRHRVALVAVGKLACLVFISFPTCCIAGQSSFFFFFLFQSWDIPCTRIWDDGLDYRSAGWFGLAWLGWELF